MKVYGGKGTLEDGREYYCGDFKLYENIICIPALHPELWMLLWRKSSGLDWILEAGKDLEKQNSPHCYQLNSPMSPVSLCCCMDVNPESCPSTWRKDQCIRHLLLQDHDEHKTCWPSNELPTMTNTQRLSNKIRQRQLHFVGHLHRMAPDESPCRTYALYIPSHGQRHPGRQKTSYLSYIQKLPGHIDFWHGCWWTSLEEMCGRLHCNDEFILLNKMKIYWFIFMRCGPGGCLVFTLQKIVMGGLTVQEHNRNRPILNPPSRFGGYPQHISCTRSFFLFSFIKLLGLKTNMSQ